MRRLRVILYVLTVLSQGAPMLGVFWALGFTGLGFVVAVVVAAVGILGLRGRIELLRHDRPIGTARRWLWELPYLAHWAGCIASLPILLVSIPASYFGAPPFPFSAAGWLEQAGIVSYALGLCLGSWSVFVRSRWFGVRHVDVDVENLPAAFEGYRIAHLSDLHIGAFTTVGLAHRWARAAARLKPDLCALTGDYVTNGVRFHQQIAEAVAPLSAPDGVVAVMGNHDYFGEGQPMMGLMEARGVRFLRNESMLLTRGEASITLAGVDDLYTRRADLDATMRATDGVAVVLAHDPLHFAGLSERGASVVLSGHTHWGQVGVPFLTRWWNLAALTHAHHSGVHREGGATLVISPGLGTTGPPLRLGARPEILLIRLRRSPANRRV